VAAFPAASLSGGAQAQAQAVPKAEELTVRLVGNAGAADGTAAQFTLAAGRGS
jgi:hypothetical protein